MATKNTAYAKPMREQDDPKPEQNLFDIFMDRGLNRIRPEMEGQAAWQFFVDLAEPESPYEKKGDTGWPYSERLIVMARKYYALDERSRGYIVKCRQSNVFWRGDDIPVFQKIVAETIRYRRLDANGKTQYHKEVMRMAKSL